MVGIVSICFLVHFYCGRKTPECVFWKRNVTFDRNFVEYLICIDVGTEFICKYVAYLLHVTQLFPVNINTKVLYSHDRLFVLKYIIKCKRYDTVIIINSWFFENNICLSRNAFTCYVIILVSERRPEATGRIIMYTK